MVKYLWRKGLVFGIVLMLFFVAVNITTAAQTTIITNDSFPLSIFDLQNYIDISLDGNEINEPFEPGGEPRNIPLAVTYGIMRGPLGQVILSYYILTKQYVIVSLEIEDIPSYCTASLNNSQLRFRITDTESTQYTVLAIAVDETAPAFEPITLKIHASVDDKKGPFGILRIIQGYETIPRISFVADYFPYIDVSPEGSYIETTPGTTVIDPITVKNLGNGGTIVIASIVECPKDWIAIITDNVYIKVNESKPMNLTIKTPVNFYGVKTVVLEFTPCYYQDFSNRGAPHYVSIGVEVKP